MSHCVGSAERISGCHKALSLIFFQPISSWLACRGWLISLFSYSILPKSIVPASISLLDSSPVVPLAIFKAADIEFTLAGLVFSLAIRPVSTPLSLIVSTVRICVVHSPIAILFHVTALSAAELTFVDVAVFVCLFQVSC